MRWFRILIGCSAASFVTATYSKDDIWNSDLKLMLEAGQPYYRPRLIPRSFQIQRRGNCLARPCSPKKREPPGPRIIKAHAVIRGPGTVQTRIADSSFKMSPVPTGQTHDIKSSHPTYAYVGAKAFDIEEGGPPRAPDPTHPLKVKSQGRHVQALITVPDGGSGCVRLSGDNGVKNIQVQEGTIGGGTAYSRCVGGAQAFGQVSRGGEAHAWGHD